MGIVCEQADDGNTIRIKISGRFDFSLHNEFRNAYKDISLSSGKYEIDLLDTDYLDSSALGMLLLLKEHADAEASKVHLVNFNDEIKEILEIASFDKLFTLG